ncbi:transcriptional regulatory domain protein [Ochrobactrum quorumnocens]|uniref:Transcriptional regulatory domain protein n=1 Tax=Ochrobactrum quorumnocens TaxID=271865 RepID=A0A248UDM2_9HYPH|nr:transcriptional regulatory domain protein [[Ochrobactrum] quorumnocens]
MTHATVLNDCDHSLSDKADTVGHITRMVAGYLGTAPLPIRTILQEVA